MGAEEDSRRLSQDLNHNHCVGAFFSYYSKLPEAGDVIKKRSLFNFRFRRLKIQNQVTSLICPLLRARWGLVPGGTSAGARNHILSQEARERTHFGKN